MVFGEVVTVVGFAAAPSNTELVLFNSVLDPVESHVHGLGSLEFGAFVGEAISCGVVCDDRCGFQLGAVEFEENLAEVNRFLAVVEEGSYFCL